MCRRRIEEDGKFLWNVIYYIYRVSCSSACPVCNLIDHRERARSNVVHVLSCRCSRLCFTCIYYFLFCLVGLFHMHGALTGALRSLKLIIECHTADNMCLNACRYFHCKGKKDSRNWAWRVEGMKGLKGYAWQANTRHVTSQHHYIIRVTTPPTFPAFRWPRSHQSLSITGLGSRTCSVCFSPFRDEISAYVSVIPSISFCFVVRLNPHLTHRMVGKLWTTFVASLNP